MRGDVSSYDAFFEDCNKCGVAISASDQGRDDPDPLFHGCAAADVTDDFPISGTDRPRVVMSFEADPTRVVVFHRPGLLHVSGRTNKRKEALCDTIEQTLRARYSTLQLAPGLSLQMQTPVAEDEDTVWAEVIPTNAVLQVLLQLAAAVLILNPTAAAPVTATHPMALIGAVLRFKHAATAVVVESRPGSPLCEATLQAWDQTVVVCSAQTMPCAVDFVLSRAWGGRGSPPALTASTWDARTPCPRITMKHQVQVPKVCLAMIVRNEEAVIERALASAWPYVDTYCIVDTGSNDGTPSRIRESAASVSKPGTVALGDWKGFGKSRSEALALARAMEEGFQWILMMDADDILLGTPGHFMAPKPEASGAAMSVVFGGSTMATTRIQVFARSQPWVYVGVMHEFPFLPPPATLAHMRPRGPVDLLPPTFRMDARTEGFRSKNPTKYLDDARILEQELARDPRHSRNLFYLAQSYKDAHMVPEAVQVYRRVVANGSSWAEERYFACLMLVELPGTDIAWAEKVHLGWQSLDFSPRRRELVTTLMKLSRLNQQWSREVYAMALHAEVHGSAACLSSFLFSRSDVYTWSFYDELSLQALAFGYQDLALRFIRTALQGCGGAAAVVPAMELARMQQNAKSLAGPPPQTPQTPQTPASEVEK